MKNASISLFVFTAFLFTSFLETGFVEAQDCSVSASNDCNGNGIADLCDIGSAFSADCNHDQIPDECELGESQLVLTPTGLHLSRTNDCDLSGVPDDCKADCNNSGKPDVCKDDLNQNGVPDACAAPAECRGLCDAQQPLFDEDQDGVSNCKEIEDGTEPCDSGSVRSLLAPVACGGPNAFFRQVNIATVLNKLPRTMHVRAFYRDSNGVTKQSVEFDLGANLKQDLIVNDMGLLPDTYGTFCIVTDANTFGAWSGGITIYKPRNVESGGFSGSEIFDYALSYPFRDPFHGPLTIPVNTNTIGTDGKGTVANWIRISDAIVGDGKPLTGMLIYFDPRGNVLGSDVVSVPNGGRVDFGAHAKFGPAQVGLAQFVPTNNGADYYLEVTRYFYEGSGASSNRFYAAFPVPVHLPTGAAVTGTARAEANELSVFELINSGTQNAVTHLEVFDKSGQSLLNEQFGIPGKGTTHRIITNELRAASTPPATAEVEGPRDGITSTTVVYGFSPAGGLLYAYAPQFNASAGKRQFSEFNSFINHENFLEVSNTRREAVNATVTVINFDQQIVSTFPLSLPAKSSIRSKLSLPKDSYGTIIVDSGAVDGLIVRNDVTRIDEYAMPFFAR